MSTYRDLTTAHAMWIPAAVKAAQQGNAKQLHKPAGFERCGYTVNYLVRATGDVRWTLSYRFGRGKNTTVATWITDWIPAERKRTRHQPITPPAEPIRITSEGCDYRAYVMLDSIGMPRPIPVMEAR